MYQTFQVPYNCYLYPKTNKSWPITANTYLDKKEIYFLNKTNRIETRSLKSDRIWNILLAHRQRYYRPIPIPYALAPSKSAIFLHFIVYVDTCQKTASIQAPQFRSIISFCSEICSSHDCLFEPTPQTVFKPALAYLVQTAHQISDPLCPWG